MSSLKSLFAYIQSIFSSTRSTMDFLSAFISLHLFKTLKMNLRSALAQPEQGEIFGTSSAGSLAYVSDSTYVFALEICGSVS